MNDDEFNLLNPTILFEVLFLSTKSYVRGNKFRLYREISALKEYIVIDPAKIHIEAFCINGEGE